VKKTMKEGRGRRTWWGWVNEGPGRGQDAGWSSSLSLPRILTLRDHGLLNIDLAPELNTLRTTRHVVQKLTVTESSPLLLNDMKGDCMEIAAQIDPGTATQVGIRVRSTIDGSEQTPREYGSASTPDGRKPARSDPPTERIPFLTAHAMIPGRVTPHE
jgi:sucrose-6-phosphate hydrolase SacC (GH32 family)